MSKYSNEFNVGDMVRIKLTGQEGNIVSALSDNTYEVELHENGSVEYYKANELERMW